MVQLLRLVVLVFEECLELHREGLLFVVGCWLLCDRYVWSYWFSRNVLNFMGRVTLCCRLLVIAQSLRLVIMVFKECLELHGEELFFIVGCWLLHNCYVWS